MIENPPLNEDLLVHFGVKGMKWGRRKVRPDEAQRKKTFGNADRNRKIKIGLAVVGGAAVAALVLTKSGRTKLTDAVVTNAAQSRSARIQAGKNPVKNLAQRFRDVKAASVPSPDRMVAEARMAGVRNQFNREGAQRLTDKAWRDQAKMASLSRDMDSATNKLLRGNGQAIQQANAARLAEVRRQLQDPNHVWQL